jgi:hypothetical protein
MLTLARSDMGDFQQRQTLPAADFDSLPMSRSITYEDINMSFLHYTSLSPKERRLAKRSAKMLLRTVPPAEISKGPSSFRGALYTAIMKPENVIAAFFYGDGNGHWWGDVVLKEGSKFLQVGTPEDKPHCSADEALETIKNTISQIKVTREHPIVQKCRDMGIDAQTLHVLRVQHEEHGCRWVVMDGKRTEREAKSYVDFFKRK